MRDTTHFTIYLVFVPEVFPFFINSQKQYHYSDTLIFIDIRALFVNIIVQQLPYMFTLRSFHTNDQNFSILVCNLGRNINN